MSNAFTLDGGTHFTRQGIQRVLWRLRVVHQFGVADILWPHRTKEQMNHQVGRTIRAVFSRMHRQSHPGS